MIKISIFVSAYVHKPVARCRYSIQPTVKDLRLLLSTVPKR
jgi:hypothetical protein